MSNKRTKTLFKPAGSVPCGGFVSFSDVVTPSHIEGDILRNASHLSPIYRGSDSDLAVAAKKMIKKDVTTKLKAFHEVISIIKDETKGHVLLTDFLPYFAHIFPRIVMENDRKVRETLFAVLIAVIEVDKTSLTPFMTHIIGIFIFSLSLLPFVPSSMPSLPPHVSLCLSLARYELTLDSSILTNTRID